jgi:type VI secretion system protein ImpL
MCDTLRPVTTKFPFSAGSSAPANLSDVDAALAPDSGSLWAVYQATLKTYVVQQGSQYVQAPNSPQPVNPRFTQFLTRAGLVSSELYPSGHKPASFSFSLHMLPGSDYKSATWVVDGQRISKGQSGSFTWNGTSAQSASLEVDSKELLSYQGTWAVFQLARTGTHISKTATGYRIEYPIDTSTTIAGHKVGSGGTTTVVFEISGPGADLLVGGATDLSCTSDVVK